LRAQMVNRMRDHFLAGPRFAAQQHGGMDRGRPFHFHVGERVLHPLALADDVDEAANGLGRLLQAVLLDDPLSALRSHELVKPDRLTDQIGHHLEQADTPTRWSGRDRRC